MNDVETSTKPETAIAAVSLESAAEKLRDQIRSAFTELIPPEQWLAMVKAELEAFTKSRRVPNPNTYQGGMVDKPSILTEMCETLFRERCKAEIAKALDEWAASSWDSSNGINPSELVAEFFKQNIEQITKAAVTELLVGGMQNVIMALRSSLNSR